MPIPLIGLAAEAVAGAGAAASSSAAAAGMTEAAVAAKSFATETNKAAGGLDKISGIIQPFVQAFNPAIMERFNYVMTNLNASVGAALDPIIKNWTVLAEEFNQIITPIAQQVGPMLKDMFEEMKPIVVAFAKVAGAWVKNFVLLSSVIYTLLWPIRQLGLAIAAVINLIPGLSGDSTSAARNAEFKSFQQTGQDLITASLNATSGETDSQKQVTLLTQIRDILELSNPILSITKWALAPSAPR